MTTRWTLCSARTTNEEHVVNHYHLWKNMYLPVSLFLKVFRGLLHVWQVEVMGFEVHCTCFESTVYYFYLSVCCTSTPYYASCPCRKTWWGSSNKENKIKEKTVISQRKSQNLAEWPILLESRLKFLAENPGIVFMLQGFGQRRRRCIVRTPPVSHRLRSSPSNGSSVWLQHLSRSDKRCSSPEQSREMKRYCGIRFYSCLITLGNTIKHYSISLKEYKTAIAILATSCHLSQKNWNTAGILHLPTL